MACAIVGRSKAALARPQTTFGGEDLYPDLAAKAAALLHSLVLNHAFVDGNKRVGAHAAVLFLLANGTRTDGRSGSPGGRHAGDRPGRDVRRSARHLVPAAFAPAGAVAARDAGWKESGAT